MILICIQLLKLLLRKFPMGITPPPIYYESFIATIGRSLQKKENEIQLLKFHLAQENNRMTQQTAKRSDRSFQVGNCTLKVYHVIVQYFLDSIPTSLLLNTIVFITLRAQLVRLHTIWKFGTVTNLCNS